MKRVGWLDMAEVGGVLGIRLLVVVSTVFGRAPARWLLHPVVLYYWVFGATARRASRDWLEKVYATRRVTRLLAAPRPPRQSGARARSDARDRGPTILWMVV